MDGASRFFLYFYKFSSIFMRKKKELPLIIVKLLETKCYKGGNMANQYHEPVELLSEKAKDITRAINSVKEELEAVDWYNQRADVCTDPELQKILEHNRNEEMEHAIMILEWLRRNMDGWDNEMKTYFFTNTNITELEDAMEVSEEGAAPVKGTSLNIGSMK